MATYSDNPQSDPQFTALDDFQSLLCLGKRLALPVFRLGRLACGGSWSCGCRYAATFPEPSSDRPSLCSGARCLSCAAGCEDTSAVPSQVRRRRPLPPAADDPVQTSTP